MNFIYIFKSNCLYKKAPSTKYLPNALHIERKWRFFSSGLKKHVITGSFYYIPTPLISRPTGGIFISTPTLPQPALDLKFSPSPRMLRGPLHPRTLPTIQWRPSPLSTLDTCQDLRHPPLPIIPLALTTPITSPQDSLGSETPSAWGFPSQSHLWARKCPHWCLSPLSSGPRTPASNQDLFQNRMLASDLRLLTPQVPFYEQGTPSTPTVRWDQP